MTNNSVHARNTDIISTLFPDNVTGIILPIADYRSHLTPDEYKYIRSASEKRRYEFSTGRWCAKQTLASEGIHNISILPGEHREPIWPENFTGSISHCKDQCGAVITKTTRTKSIGFDVENIKELKNNIAKAICTDEEKDWLRQQSNYVYDTLVLTIFSLKESVYKCVYQHQQVKLGFKDCSIIADHASNSASIVFDNVAIDPGINLRFTTTENHIYSGAFYPR